MNPASLEAEREVVRVQAPRQQPHWEPQEQARKVYASRALNRAKRNVNTRVALEAKALGGDGAEVPAALVAATKILRKTAKPSV